MTSNAPQMTWGEACELLLAGFTVWQESAPGYRYAFAKQRTRYAYILDPMHQKSGIHLMEYFLKDGGLKSIATASVTIEMMQATDWRFAETPFAE
jgi:hypothetical protein